MRPSEFPDAIRFGLPALLAAVCGHAASAQEISELFEPLEQPWLSVNAPLEASDEEDRIETDRDTTFSSGT